MNRTMAVATQIATQHRRLAARRRAADRPLAGRTVLRLYVGTMGAIEAECPSCGRHDAPMTALLPSGEPAGPRQTARIVPALVRRAVTSLRCGSCASVFRFVERDRSHLVFDAVARP